MAVKKGNKSERYEPIPYASEQGIFCGLAGNLNRRSGKLLPSSGNPLSSAIWGRPIRSSERSRRLHEKGKEGRRQIARVAEGPGRGNSLAERAPPRSPSGASRRGGVGQACR